MARLSRMFLLAGALTAGMLTAAAPAGAVTTVPHFTHIVVVVMENHSEADVVGNPDAPYLNSLMTSGANFTNSFAVTHPSQPNYLALFSGSTQGVVDDSCPVSYTTGNLGAQLIRAGRTFVGYSEDLPSAGSTVCGSGGYARKHNPWVDSTKLPATVNQPMTAFPTDFTTLPTVAFVVPNLQHDMHDGTIAQGDAWVQANLSAYATWAAANKSLLIVTWDEDDHSQNNQIPTVFVGARVRAGSYAGMITHYRVLRTLEAAYGLPGLGNAATVNPIGSVWT